MLACNISVWRDDRWEERPGTPPCAHGNWTEGVRLRRYAFRYRPCPNLPRPTTFCGPQPTETRTHHADKCSSILVSHPRDHKCSVVNPNMLGQLHSGASIRVVPCATRSCRTTVNCCGSCSSGSGSSLQCMAYTSGDTCSNTPISCPTLFDPLPSDEIGSRPSGSCPASRPYQTDKGCCGACRTDQGTVMAFDCGTTCSSSPRPGRFVHSRHLPP